MIISLREYINAEKNSTLTNLSKIQIQVQGLTGVANASAVKAREDMVTHILTKNPEIMSSLETRINTNLKFLDKIPVMLTRIDPRFKDQSDLLFFAQETSHLDSIWRTKILPLSIRNADRDAEVAFQVIARDENFPNILKSISAVQTGANTEYRTMESGISERYELFTLLAFAGFILFSALVIIRAQTVNKKLNQQMIHLEEANKRMLKLDKVKTNFLANISHELQTPMNSILGVVELLKYKSDVVLDSSEKELIQIFETSSYRLIKTLRKMIEMSDLETQSIKLTVENLDTIALLKSTIGSISVAASRKSLRIINDESKIIPGIRGDYYTLYHALEYIFENAVKYTRKGTISINSEAVDGYLVVKISDTGIGVKPDRLKYIKEGFVQGSEGYSKSYQGIGLGLSIADNYIRRNGGRMEITSRENSGTTVSVWLPLAQHISA